ncbi:hypothetical protein ACHAXR_005468 [Thalassiosira sp. AJA248-18]
MSKKEKLTFLSRLLAIVSQVTGRRLDVLVSPSKILCGQDVLLTHEFLRALASSTMIKEERRMAKAVKYVLEEGDANLYKRGVRTRKAFISVQAIFRGWQVRRRYYQMKGNDETANKGPVEVEDECNNSSLDSNEEVEGEGSDVHQSKNALPKASKSRSTSKSKSDEDSLLESYQAMLSRKSKVEDDIKVAEAKLQRENDKLIRMLNLGTMHKTRTHAVPYGGMPRPPLSAPSIGMNNANNAVTNNRPYKIDEAFRDKVTNFSERQRSIKQKERRIEEREGRLKQRFAKSKHKEAELKLQEERISDLAGKIRKQQLQLKEQRLQFERSKLLEPDSPPETSRPCVMCTEKKIQMREIRSKVRQRTRVLNQREAVVVERAHELRRRESQLVKREEIVADLEQQSTSVDELLLEYPYEESPPPENRTEKQQRQRMSKKDKEPMKNTLPDVRDGTNPPRKKGDRKRRRRRSPQESSNREVNVEQNSMRASFGESIPTIVEEPPAVDQDEQRTAEEDDTATTSESAEKHDAECPVEERKRVSKENLVLTDIHKVRQQLGISKSKKRETPSSSTGPPRRTSTRKSQDETTGPTRIETRRISQAPSPKKRHVFTFERKESPNHNMHHLQHSESKSLRMPDIGDATGRRISATPVRERDKKPRASPSTREKHDDWISSFDVQMKVAMTRLKELV